MGDNEQPWQVWVCGRHSGYPRCCVFWYLIRDRVGWWRILARNSLLWVVLEDFGRFRAGYIRCPACVLRGRRVESLPCPEGYHDWHDELDDMENLLD